MSFSSVPVSIHLHQSKTIEMMIALNWLKNFTLVAHSYSFILTHTLCCVWEVAGPFV